MLGQKMYKNVAIANSFIFLFGFFAFSSVSAAEVSFPVTDIPTDQQSEMMAKYCVICHMDEVNNGGLSLEHFDASLVSPALAAILVSKFTTGVPLSEILKPEMTLATVQAIEEGKKQGAPSVMGLAGLPLPTEGEVNGFILAMASRTQRANQWHVSRDGDVINADIALVTPLPERWQGRELIYRLALSCDVTSGEGSNIISWSPIPVNGTLEVIVDDGEIKKFILDQQESMANGSPGISSPSSVVLSGMGKSDKHPTLGMPKNKLQIKGPLLTGQVEFTFNTLSQEDREKLALCFEKQP